MKNVVSFCMAGLYMNCKQMKPFNPILGETYQVTIHDSMTYILGILA